jgi:hypothetical protein
MASEPKAKRMRSNNYYRKEEELLLLEQISKFKKIIECKTTDKVTSQEKVSLHSKYTPCFQCNKITNFVCISN